MEAAVFKDLKVLVNEFGKNMPSLQVIVAVVPGSCLPLGAGLE